jgi:hypothetical protein
VEAADPRSFRAKTKSTSPHQDSPPRLVLGQGLGYMQACSTPAAPLHRYDSHTALANGGVVRARGAASRKSSQCLHQIQ